MTAEGRERGRKTLPVSCRTPKAWRYPGQFWRRCWRGNKTSAWHRVTFRELSSPANQHAESHQASRILCSVFEVLQGAMGKLEQ